MATEIKKTIKRKLKFTTDIARRPLVMKLEPSEIIGFRQKGKKTWYEIPLSYVYMKALEMYVLEKHKERLKQYEIAKKLGKRVRRPKKPIGITSL